MIAELNKIFQQIAVTFHPYRWWLLISWIIAALGIQFYEVSSQATTNILMAVVGWPFYLWFVVVLWGNPDAPGYKKTPSLIMCIYSASAVVGVAMLPIISFLGVYRAIATAFSN